MTLSAASAAYVKHEITFNIGLRIATDTDTDTVRIQYAYGTDPQHPCVGVKGVLELEL